MLRDLAELTSDLAEPFHSNARNLNTVGQRKEQVGGKTHQEMEPILAYFAENKNKKTDSINTDLINTQQKTKGGAQKGRREKIESTQHLNLIRK